MSRNKGSKDARGRFSTVAQMQRRSDKLAAAIAKFIGQAHNQHQFNKLTDFSLLHEAKRHLLSLSELPIK